MDSKKQEPIFDENVSKTNTALYAIDKRCYEITDMGGILISEHTSPEKLQEILETLKSTAGLFNQAISEISQLLNP